MRTKTRTALNLLNLENRITPAATISLLNGNLTITGDNNTNTIVAKQVAGTSNIEVYVRPDLVPSVNLSGLLAQSIPSNSAYRGTYTATGTLTINSGNSRDQVVVFIPGGSTLSNNIRINTGNSADDINITSESSTQAATVAGNVTLNGGLGADNYNFGLVTVQGMVDVTGGGGGTRPDELNRPGDYVRFFDSVVQGMAIVRNASVSLDDFFSQLPGQTQVGSTIEGSLIVSNQGGGAVGSFNVGFDGDDTTLTPIAGYSLIAAIGPRSTVNGDLVYTGSGSNDGVFVAGTVNGRVTVVGYAGTNELNLAPTSSAPNTYNGTVSGDVTYVGQSGADIVNFGASTIGLVGSVSLNMGDGANVYDMSGAFLIGGSLTVNAGSGNDTVNIGASSSINGNLNMNLGTGNNVVELAGTISGSQINLQFGGGNDTVTIAAGSNGAAAKLAVYLGAGNDRLNVASSNYLSAYLDGNTGTDTISFAPMFVVPINWTLIGFDASV